MRTLFRSLLIATGALLVAHTSQAATTGKDYLVLAKPQPTKTQAGKPIEVIEFFWYGCGHCANLEPKLNTWLATRLPSDVTFRRIPASWRPIMDKHAQIYYTLEQMKIVGPMHSKVFDALQKEQLALHDEEVLVKWVGSQGVNAAAFKDTYNSFSVVSQYKRGQQIMQSYNISGVPTFIINGKYQTSVGQAQSEDNLFNVIDALIVKERGSASPKAAAPAPQAKPAAPAVKPKAKPAPAKPASKKQASKP